MITIGPSGDLRIEATVGVIVVFDGALKVVGSNPPAYQKFTSIAATGIGTKDVLLTNDGTHEAFIKSIKVINYAALGAAAVFTLYRDGTANVNRASITFNVPIECEFIIDDLGERCLNANGNVVAV